MPRPVERERTAGYLQICWDALFRWSFEIGWKDAGFPLMQRLSCKVVARVDVLDRILRAVLDLLRP